MDKNIESLIWADSIRYQVEIVVNKMPAPVLIWCRISKQAQNILGLIELIINSCDIDYLYRGPRV